MPGWVVEIGCALISAAAAIIVAMVSADMKKANKKAEKRADMRKQESRLSLEMISATLELSIVCANALTGGHNNGNVEVSREKAKKAEDAYRAFEHTILAEELSA